MDFHASLMPRLQGEDIERDFGRYESLVKKGVAGFIVFGGELESLREGIRRLQELTATPLLMASDLEQGLGQQVRGGTLFPPAMALKQASKMNGNPDPGVLRAAFSQMADEAAYCGINMIFAPVLDVNTNPLNPIICTRAFCETPEVVSSLASEMIRTIEAKGVKTCGKHFPGHGDTGIDSHEKLPEVHKSIEELESLELRPFLAAVEAGVSAMMNGHLSVPAIDPAGIPMSISAEAVKFLREKIGFRGIIVTDAMNMGALRAYQEPGAALMALRAGVDLIVHPNEPEQLARELESAGLKPVSDRLAEFRKTLLPAPSQRRPAFDPRVALELTEKGITTEGPLHPLKEPFLVLISDERMEKGRELAAATGFRHMYLTPDGGFDVGRIPLSGDVVVAAFCTIKAWKEDTTAWLKASIGKLSERGRVFISLGNPYILDGVGMEPGKARLFAYWGSPEAQRALAKRLLSR